MRRGLLLFALVCVVLGGLAYRYVFPSTGRGTASLVSMTTTESASSIGPAQQARTQSGMTEAADLAALPALHRERIEVGDALWEAATPEQAAWLNRHGFPTQGQLAAFNGAQAAQLPADGRARSPVDVVVAESVAMSDPVAKARALALLRGASEAGSSYALQSLARIAQLSERDPVKAEGYYRAALLRGDWLVGLREIPRLAPEQNYAADLRAARLLEQINRARRQRGLPALGVDLRPGAEEAFELLSGGKR